jgi:hypothetical protein
MMTKSAPLVGMLVKKGQFSAAVIKEDYGIIFLQSLSQTL